MYRNIDGYREEDGRYAAFMADISAFIPQQRQFTDPVRTFAYGTDASFYRLNPKLVVKARPYCRKASSGTYCSGVAGALAAVECPGLCQRARVECSWLYPQRCQQRMLSAWWSRERSRQCYTTSQGRSVTRACSVWCLQRATWGLRGGAVACAC